MKRRYYLLLSLLVMSSSSCKKDFLETVPTDFLAPETYYQTEEHLKYAKASVYNNLGAGALFGSWANYLLGWSADEGYMNRSSLVIGPWNHNFVPTDTYNAGFWSNLYDGINRANVVLANVDKNTTIPQELRDQVRGEVLFLRGYYYFLLAQYYGGVPLKLTPTASVEDVDAPKATLKEVYDQIIKDMTEAEPLVSSIAANGFGGQVSKSAVRGMLARVNLYMAGQPLKETARYAEAKKWAKMVMDDAAHALNPSFAQVFINYAADKYDTKESIWEVEFWGNRLDSYTKTTNVGWINGPAVAATQTNTGRADAYMNITSKLYNVYEPGDLRKWWSIASFTYDATGPNGSKTYRAEASNEGQKFGFLPAKWRREYEALLPKAPTQTPQNHPILRFSDVLLMFAEAENELNGPTAEAIAAVNRVRRRSWSTGIKSITVTKGGSGYTSAPTVTFSDENGSGAEATATITNGVVTGISLVRDAVTFTKMGKYTAPPTITISGGDGSGATAEATIFTLEDADATPAQTASKESFRRFLQDERMRELNFEGMRKADLIRWGIFVETMQDMGNTILLHLPTAVYRRAYSSVEPKHVLMPIPSSEMNVNEAISQNPGWE